MDLKTWRSMSLEERMQEISAMPSVERKDLNRRIMRSYNRKMRNNAMKSLGLKKVIAAVTKKTDWE